MTPSEMRDGDSPVVLHMIPLGGAPFRGAYRWAVYRTDTDRPTLLWGDTSHDAEVGAAAWLAECRKGAEAWPGMVYYPRPARGRELPVYHFALDFGPNSWGRTNEAENFAHALARAIGRPVRLSLLAGWHADTVEGAP